MSRLTLAGVWVALLCGSSTAIAQDHLEVPRSVLSDFKISVDYDRIVRETLLTRARQDPYLRVVVEPSFQSEWMVEVTESAGGVAHIQLVVATTPVWNGGTPLAQPVRSVDATVPSDIAERLRRIWMNMLRGVRPSEDPRIGVDGINYHFAAFVLGEGIFAGEVWSPQANTKTDRLVRLAVGLREIAEAPAEQRTSLLERLQTESKAFARLLGVAQ